MNDKPNLPTGSNTPIPATPVDGFLRLLTFPNGGKGIEMFKDGVWAIVAAPPTDKVRHVIGSDGNTDVEVLIDGEWRLFSKTRMMMPKPAVGQVMRLDTDGGWRYEMFDGDKWVFLGEALLQEGRAKLIGDFPDDADLVLAATMHATTVEAGPKHWGPHYTFDLTGLRDFLDHIMDDHRYPALPDAAELEREAQDAHHAMELALMAFDACAEIECERTGQTGSYVDWDKVRDATEALRAILKPRSKP